MVVTTCNLVGNNVCNMRYFKEGLLTLDKENPTAFSILIKVTRNLIMYRFSLLYYNTITQISRKSKWRPCFMSRKQINNFIVIWLLLKFY